MCYQSSFFSVKNKLQQKSYIGTHNYEKKRNKIIVDKKLCIYCYTP